MISIWLISPYFIVHSKFEVIMFVVNGSQYVMYTYVCSNICFHTFENKCAFIQIDLCFFRLVYCFFFAHRGANILNSPHLLPPSILTHQQNIMILSSPIQSRMFCIIYIFSHHWLLHISATPSSPLPSSYVQGLKF